MGDEEDLISVKIELVLKEEPASEEDNNDSDYEVEADELEEEAVEKERKKRRPGRGGGSATPAKKRRGSVASKLERRRELDRNRKREMRALQYKVSKGEKTPKSVTDEEKQKLAEKIEQRREADRLKKRELRAQWRKHGLNARGLPFSKKVLEKEELTPARSKKIRTTQQRRLQTPGDLKEETTASLTDEEKQKQKIEKRRAADRLKKRELRAQWKKQGLNASGLPFSKKILTEEELTCPVCSKKFKTTQQRKRHYHKDLNEETPFLCSKCPKAFPTEPLLRQHEKRTHADKVYLCGKGCGAILKTDSGQRTHEKKCDGTGTPVRKMCKIYGEVDESKYLGMTPEEEKKARKRDSYRRWREKKQKAPARDQKESGVQRQQQRIRLARRRGQGRQPKTKEEKLADQRRRGLMQRLRRKLKIQRMLDSGMTMEEIHWMNQTQEKREQELIRHRVNWARGALRKRLEQAGVSPEEIQRRTEAITKETYQTSNDFRPYKPRPLSFKPVDPSQLQKIAAQSKRKPREVPTKVTTDKTPIPAPAPPSPPPPPSSTVAYPQLAYHVIPEFGGGEHSNSRTDHTPQSSQPAYHPQDTSSAHYESGGDSCYYDNDDDNYSPPPPASPSEVKADEKPVTITNVTSSKQKSSKQRQRKPDRRRRIRNPNGNPRPRLTKEEVERLEGNVICDECGRAFATQHSLNFHKRCQHDPNYDVEKRSCRLCGEVFKNAELWRKHYVNTHKRPTIPKPEKAHMCEICGTELLTLATYKVHMHKVHGEGSKKENHFRCPICPEENLYKDKMWYMNHLKIYHPDYVPTDIQCELCDKRFPNKQEVQKHVKDSHPEKYFECEHCHKYLFSYLALKFHFGRCKNLSFPARRALREKIEGKGEVFNVEVMGVSCEFCGRTMRSQCLAKHYRAHHNAKEDPFECDKCEKGKVVFIERAHWLNHLEEKHGVALEVLREIGGKLNRKCREGVSVEYAIEWPPRPDKRRKGPGGRGGGRGGRGGVRTLGGGGRERGRRKIKSEDEEDESEEESVSSDDSLEEVDRKVEQVVAKKKRKVVVIAEEDEENEGVTAMVNVCT